jgi:DNA polymerase III delta prime subunit
VTEILGHHAAREALRSLYRNGGPHTLLLAGPEGVGRRPVARWLAALLDCQAPDSAARPCGTCSSCRALEAGDHPDVRVVAPSLTTRSGRQRRQLEITIDQLVARPQADPDPLGPWLERRPRYARRVAIIDHAEALNASAANAFLKMLEEPPPWAVIVLIATGPDALLPTVASRCATLRLGAVDVASFEGLERHPAFRLGLPGPLLQAREDAAGYRAQQEAVDRLVAALDGDLRETLDAAEALAGRLERSESVAPMELLREALRGLPAPAYVASLDAIETCERALEAYASQPLALATLALDLRAAVRP